MSRAMLTKSERQIMDLLWRIDRPLSASEIIDLSPERSWKASYVHILIHSLIEKDMIVPTGLARTSRNYARVFVPTSTLAQYTVRALTDGAALPTEDIVSAVEELISSAADEPSAVAALKKMLDAKKRALKAEQP